MDRRYTDYDVRSNPNLKHLARAYLKEYAGQFQFLIECKHVMETGVLTNQQYRGVLNSMLADPKVQNMPTPIYSAFNADQFAPRRGGLELNLHTDPVPPTRPQHIKLPTRWHHPYGISNHQQAISVHVVDTARSHGIFHVAENEVEWRFYWLCAGYSAPKPYEKRLALFGLDDAVLLVQTGNASHIKHLSKGEMQRNWKWCRTCVKMSHAD